MKKALCALLAMLLLVMSCSITSFAEENSWYEEIERVSMVLDYTTFKAKEKYTKDDINVIPEGSQYTVKSQSLNKSTYREGDQPVFTVTLEADEGYRFASTAYYRDNVHVTGGEAYSASRASSGKTLTVKIHLDEVLEADDPGWDDPHSEPSSGGTSSGGPGDVKPTQGAWLKDPNNGRWWFSLPNGTRPVSSWMQISGKWYYFDQLGYAIQNTWIKWQNKWYYCGPDGDMYVNRKTPDGYYVDRNGVWDGKAKS